MQIHNERNAYVFENKALIRLRFCTHKGFLLQFHTQSGMETGSMTTHGKKLIEVALPLEAINKASDREKAIRHGHLSTLRLWWVGGHTVEVSVCLH